MTKNELLHRAKRIFDLRIASLLDAKSDQYAVADVHENFMRGAAMLGVSPEEYLMTIATKHWVALCLTGKTMHQEEIDERALDIINYMLLLMTIREEEVPF